MTTATLRAILGYKLHIAEDVLFEQIRGTLGERIFSEYLSGMYAVEDRGCDECCY